MLLSVSRPIVGSGTERRWRPLVCQSIVGFQIYPFYCRFAHLVRPNLEAEGGWLSLVRLTPCGIAVAVEYVPIHKLARVVDLDCRACGVQGSRFRV
jgi:hypothetical protein